MPKKKKGRPSIYCEELASQICIRLATGESLVEICREDKMPGYSTIMEWLFKTYESDDPRCDFPELYARAREVQAETYADQMVAIADDDSGDVLRDLDGNVVGTNNVRINRHRLRVDTRKWIVSKLLPRYSDRVTHEGGEKPIPLEVEVPDLRELARQTALILYRADPKRIANQQRLTDQRKK